MFLAACAGDGPALAPIVPDTRDRAAPILDVRAPLRGSIVAPDATTVAVRGFVRDDSAVTLLVNGKRARVGGDGSFEVDVPIVPGVNLVQTVALDARGNQRGDTRAVLAGALVDARTPVADGVVARLDAAAIVAGGPALARRLAATDLGAALARRNPLHQNALPCIGSRADLSRLAHRVVRLDVAPAHGGLLVDVELADLALALQVTYATSCQAVRGEAIAASARAFHLRGVVGLTLVDGRVAVDTGDASGWLDGLIVDGAALPARVAGELEAALEGTLTALLMEQVAGELPSLLLRNLGAVADGPGLAVALLPTELVLDQSGAVVVAASEARAGASGGAMYLPRGAVRPASAGRSGLAVGVADDALNQLVATAWAAGLLDRARRDAAGDDLRLSPRLPPQLTVLADGRVRLVAGDLEADVSSGGRSVARLAVSVDVVLEPRLVDGRLALAPAIPALFVDRLDDGPAAAAGAAELVAAELADAVSAAVGALPLPAMSERMSLTAQRDPYASGAGGYLVVTSPAGG
jgi:hypothetical protein